MMLALFFAAVLGSSAGEPVKHLYVDALTAMANLPQPQYVTYELQAQSEGLQVDPVIQGGNVWLNIHGGSTPADWNLEHRTADYRTAFLDRENNKRYYTARSFFDPTWYGSLRALREGMFNSQDPAAPRPQTTPTPQPDLQIKTIAVVAAMGPGIYLLEDRGPAACSNGDSGHALHLISRTRDPRHQLTDVIIDTTNNRFCMLRFAVNGGLGFHGIMEEHYADVGGYWMQTDGFLDGTIRVAFIAVHHGVWKYQLKDVEFPASIPGIAFEPAP